MGTQNLNNNSYFFHNLIDLDATTSIDEAVQNFLTLLSSQYNKSNFGVLLFIPKNITINYDDNSDDSKTIISSLKELVKKPVLQVGSLQVGGKLKNKKNKTNKNKNKVNKKYSKKYINKFSRSNY